MADFPALGGGFSTRDASGAGVGGPSLLSFSSIAGGRGLGAADVLRGAAGSAPTTADFTIDDFPALTPGGGGGGGAGGSSSSGNSQVSQLPPHLQQQASQQQSASLRQHQQQQQQDQQILSSHLHGAQNIAHGDSNGTTPSGVAMSPLGPGTAFGGPSVLSNEAVQRSSASPAGIPTPGSTATASMSGKRPVGAGSMYASGKSQPSSNPDAASSRSTTPTDLTLTPLGGPTPIPPAGITDKYGLYGLIDLIRLTDPDANMIHLGCDLTSLGLDLATNDPLYSTFMSPFSEHPTLGSEPQFTLPGCYNLLQPPPPAMTKVSSFSDETLFYVFYAQPREALQEAAAQELYNRSWRFHKELKLWVSKDRSPESIAAEAAISTKGAGFERGIFIFFDPGVWTRVKKEWVVYYDQLEERGIYGAGVNGLPTTGSASGTPASSEEAENTGSATTAVTTGGTPAHVSSSSSPAAGGFGNDAGLQRPGGSSGWAASPQPTNGEVTAGR